MTLNSEAMEKAHEAYAKTTGGMLDGHPMANAITAYLSALPSGDELEVVAWRYAESDVEWGVTTEAEKAARLGEIVPVEPLVRQSDANTRIQSLMAEVERVTGERDEARSLTERQKEAGYCDANWLSDGPPFKCGWQSRAEAAEQQVQSLTAEREAMARDWSEFCAAIGVEVDTHEAVADEIWRERGNG